MVESRLEHFIKTYKQEFINKEIQFEKHIRSLTSHWRDSGYILDSVLTPSKQPIEFSYNFKNPTISYTVDPGLASYDCKQKWSIIDKVIGRPISKQKSILKQYMRSHDQRYGCWLSVRHLIDGIVYKMYQEITEQMQDTAAKEITEHLSGLKSLQFRTKLIGVNPNTEDIEYYLNFGMIDESTLFEIMKIADVQIQCPSFVVQLAALKGANYQTVFKGLNVGASFKIGHHSKPLLTLFFHAPELFSSNVEACARILKLGNEYGDVKLYQKLTTRILDATNHTEVPIHSVLSFKFSNNQDFDFSVGLSPC